MTPAERLEVWQDPGGLWRWAYVQGDPASDDGGLELPASEPALTRDEALAAARLAYPGVPVTDPADDRAGPPAAAERRRGRRWPWRLATVALTGGLAALAARYRRWGIVALAPVLAAGAVARLRRQLH